MKRDGLQRSEDRKEHNNCSLKVQIYLKINKPDDHVRNEGYIF